eukprot:sb/3473448/
MAAVDTLAWLHVGVDVISTTNSMDRFADSFFDTLKKIKDTLLDEDDAEKAPSVCNSECNSEISVGVSSQHDQVVTQEKKESTTSIPEIREEAVPKLRSYPSFERFDLHITAWTPIGITSRFSSAPKVRGYHIIEPCLPLSDAVAYQGKDQ